MNKTQISLIIFIIIVFTVVAFYTGKSYQSFYKIETVKTEEKKDDVNMFVYSVSDKNGNEYSKVNIDYPQVKGASKEFNDSIKNYIESELKTFKQNAEENWKARRATAMPGESIPEYPSENEKFEFTATWNMPVFNNDGVSILTTIYQFSGGAHGSTNLKSFNFDFNKNKVIELSDLFKPDEDYLKKVSDYCISDLTERFVKNNITDLDSVREGAGPDIKNFDTFTFNKNTITFYFKQYSIGPYSMGIQSVEMYK